MVLFIVQDVGIKVVQRILPGAIRPKQRICRVLLDGSENEFSVLMDSMTRVSSIRCFCADTGATRISSNVIGIGSLYL